MRVALALIFTPLLPLPPSLAFHTIIQLDAFDYWKCKSENSREITSTSDHEDRNTAEWNHVGW